MVVKELLENPLNVLAMKVTLGLLAGAEPDAHQFNVTICFKG
jgi:hypothetical protein